MRILKVLKIDESKSPESLRFRIQDFNSEEPAIVTLKYLKKQHPQSFIDYLITKTNFQRSTKPFHFEQTKQIFSPETKEQQYSLTPLELFFNPPSQKLKLGILDYDAIVPFQSSTAYPVFFQKQPKLKKVYKIIKENKSKRKIINKKVKRSEMQDENKIYDSEDQDTN